MLEVISTRLFLRPHIKCQRFLRSRRNNRSRLLPGSFQSGRRTEGTLGYELEAIEAIEALEWISRVRIFDSALCGCHIFIDPRR